MPVETATTIDQLVVTNPLATDSAGTTDDHLRLIKSTIKNTFPNVAGATTVSHTDLNKLPTSQGFLVSPNQMTLWPNTSPPPGWRLCSAGQGNTSTGYAIPNLNSSNRVGTTYWIIKV